MTTIAPPADDAAAAPGDAIVVTGYRQSIEQSLEQKREANSLIEVITAEDIGNSPTRMSPTRCSAFPV